MLVDSCRRNDTYPDYKNIIGKYKLICISKTNIAWPSDSVVRIVPNDNYEIDFKKMSKVMLSKNGHCEKTLKIFSCKESYTTSTPRYWNFKMNIDKNEFVFSYPYYLSLSDFSDTLITDNLFYPNDIIETNSGDFYTSIYFRQ